MKFYGGGAYFGSNPSEVAFYDGTNPTSTLVPDTFNIALDGRNYMVDLAQPFYRQLRRTLEPLIRTQADTSNEPGEQSIDPNGLWRRSFEDWRDGAGQRYLDRNTSQDNAYWQSKGVDAITTAWQISLLPAAYQVKTSSTEILMTIAGNYLFIVEYGTTNAWHTPLTSIVPGGSPTWTAVTGLAGSCSSICSDGVNTYYAMGASGLYISQGTGVASQLVTSGLSALAMVAFVNGRLMVSSSNSIYNIVSTTPAALPTALQTFGNPNAYVTCFAEGNNWLYAGVNSGSIGYVYGAQTSADGTTLSPPAVQTQLPAGELVFSLCGYLGYLVVGTSLGVRVCQQGATGVTLGTLIPTPNRVLALAPWGSFVYFALSQYDATPSSGLGKISLENFVVEGILPAYQSDRMYSISAEITTLAVVNGMPVWSPFQGGVIIDSTSLVTSGTVQSGYILYDLTDPKVPALLDVQGAGVQEYGTYEAALSIDGMAFQLVGSAAPGSLVTNTYQLQQGSGSRFEVLLTLFADTGTPSRGPTITRWTLRSYPAPLRPKTWQLPLVLDEKETNASGQSGTFDPEFELNYIEALANSATPVLYQEGSESYLVFVTDVSFIATDTTSDRHYFNGIALVNIQSIPVPTPQYL